jgi:hypothetical protein
MRVNYVDLAYRRLSRPLNGSVPGRLARHAPPLPVSLSATNAIRTMCPRKRVEKLGTSGGIAVSNQPTEPQGVYGDLLDVKLMGLIGGAVYS